MPKTLDQTEQLEVLRQRYALAPDKRPFARVYGTRALNVVRRFSTSG